MLPEFTFLRLVRITVVLFMLACPGTNLPAASAPAIRIMPIGDSVTAGYTDNPSWSIRFDFGYRLGLYSRMTNAGHAVQFLGSSPEPWTGEFGQPKTIGSPDLRNIGQDRHHGYAWLTAAVVQEKIAGWVETDRPDVILLMLGGINFQTTRDVDSVLTELSDLLDKIVSEWPKVHVIVAQIPPFAVYFREVAIYNELIRTVLVPGFAERGHRVTTVDQYSNFLRPGGRITDIDRDRFSNGWHHPTPEAYDRMAQTWFEGIRTLFPQESISLIEPPSMLPNGYFRARFSGRPHAIYQIDRAAALEGPWDLGFRSVTADADGHFDIEDSTAGSAHFYRVSPQ